MSWYKKSSNIKNKIKYIFKNHPFFKDILNNYMIPIDKVDDLQIHFKKLNGMLGFSDSEKIVIDVDLLENNFFTDNFYPVVHEFFHWVKRMSEKMFYFNDAEEVQGFILSMSWEFKNGKTKQEVINIFKPLILKHFKNKNQAKSIFKKMIERAESM